jgi:hypothetical protein
MTPFRIALLMLPLGLAQAQAPDAQAGKTIWESFENDCNFVMAFMEKVDLARFSRVIG